MTSLSLLVWIILGIAVQLGLFLGVSFWRHWQDYRRLVQGMPEAVELAPAVGLPDENSAGWSGFRSFRVARRTTEDAGGQICSFYLEPADGQPLPSYLPGQFLTFRLDLAKAEGRGSASITRCYSLSDAPASDCYRISIKRVPAPPGSAYPAGRSSNFFHDDVQVGATLQVRAPSGHFYLAAGSGPVVLVSGGIGITPLLSMLNWCRIHQPEREIRFFHGLRNSREGAFLADLRAAAAAAPSVHLYLCFSDPLPEDQLGRDFHHHGRVGVNLFRMELPLKPYHYYICGPAPMMEALLPALADWGVPDSRIHFEAFGPASGLRRRAEPAALAEHALPDPANEIIVTFATSGKKAQWSAQSGNLLDFAEAQGVAVDSGCRAGGCGTCQTTIVSGEVSYRQTPDYDPLAGTCLLCVCTPKTHLTLEA